MEKFGKPFAELTTNEQKVGPVLEHGNAHDNTTRRGKVTQNVLKSALAAAATHHDGQPTPCMCSTAARGMQSPVTNPCPTRLWAPAACATEPCGFPC
jgi:hypothetical protein